MRDIFSFHYFSFFLEFIFQRKSRASQNDSVKIQRDSKGLSWLIVCDCVACVQNNTEQYYQRSFVIPSTVLETTTAGQIHSYDIKAR